MEQPKFVQTLQADNTSTAFSPSTYKSPTSPGSSNTNPLTSYNDGSDTEKLLASADAGLQQPRLRPAGIKKGQELPSTAYLDALRGYAAWVVYNSHVIHEDWRPETSALMKWPCFQILFRGHAQVDVFFVISGYVLSYRMLGYMHSQQPQRVLDSLSSSVFRRYLRLFLPTAAASFVTMIALTLRLATKGEGEEVLKVTFVENLVYWIVDTVRASNPFSHVAGWWYGDAVGTKYLPQMWTIAVEFRGSMILFMFCAATCRMPFRKRFWTLWTCIVVFFWWQAQYAGLFLAGMVIADVRIWNESKRQDHQLPSTSPKLKTTNPSSNKPYTNTTPTFVRQLPYISLAIFSLKLLTAPLVINNGHPFPFNILARLMPPKIDDGAHVHWPLSVGAVILVYALDNSPILQKPLRWPVSQFIGQLSFGLYAMHITVRWIVWENVFVKWQFAYLGPDAKGFWNFLPGYLIMTVLVIWAAEWFRRVDMRVVAWGKTLQDYCFES